jgi:hypothetical protein
MEHMTQLAKKLLLGCVAVVFASSQAWAQGEIQKVRVGGTPQYDRLVFVLGTAGADVYSVDGDRYVVEFTANPPAVDFATQDKLTKIGVAIERASNGTRVSVDRRGRNVAVFKLPAADATSGPRVVLDVAKAGQALSVPADAERVAVRAAAPSAPSVATAPPTPAPAPAPAIETPRPSESPIGGEIGPVVGSGLPSPGGPYDKGQQIAGLTPSTPSGSSSPAPSAGPEEVWVSVRAIDFEGVISEAPSRDDLLNLELNVSVAENGDLVAPRTDLPVQTVTLRALTGDGAAAQKGRVGGSLLQQIVERIADEYEERGKYGTRIDISKRDLERLLKDQDGRLVIRISEPSDAGANS